MALSSNSSVVVQQIGIKVGGANLPATVMDRLESAFVETSLEIPSMFVLRFNDDDVSLINGTTFVLGAAVVISLPSTTGTTTTMVDVITAEITAIEPDYDMHSASLTIRGYDKRHRLTYGTFTRTFVNSTDTDIVRKIARESGLQVSAGSTTTVHEHVFQDNRSNLHFIQELAIRNGFGVFMNGSQLVFDQFTQGTTISLDWGVQLISFSPRLSIAGQLKKATVKSWDVNNKQAITGETSTSSSHPTIGFGKSGGEAVQAAINKETSATEVRVRVGSQSDAEKVAQGILDKSNASFVEAQGQTFGNGALTAGTKVQLGKLGAKFNGTYLVSFTRHSYEHGTYITDFSIEGYQPKMLGDLLESSGNSRGLWHGVVPAIVTNSNDSEGSMARVKVKYPWLSDNEESGWARVTMVGAGMNRGLLWVPEVNDEVLVAFEHGDFNRPFVIGSLYNGVDTPPETTFHENGNIERRTLKTRAGHIIRLTDTDGQEKIEIIDAKTKTQVIMDTAVEKITIQAGKEIMIEGTETSITLRSKDITLDATGKVMIKASQSIEMESFEIKAKSNTNMNLEADVTMTIKSGILDMKAQGNATLQATGMLSISSSAITEVKGSLVKIN